MKNILFITLSLFISSVQAACPNGKTYPVTLTFDDGPHPTLTPKVLKILEEEKVKATFFLLGENFPGGKSKPENKWAYDIMDKQKKAGHYIGSHTYHHWDHSQKLSRGQITEADMKKNILRTGPALKDYLSPIMRLPYGAGSFRSSNAGIQKNNDKIMKTIKDAGYKHVGWDIDTEDWDAKKRANLLPSTLRQICSAGGGVILFHDIQSNTVAHLREWIRGIRAQGHTIVGLEHFVPEVKNPVPTKMCQQITISKPVEELSRSVQKATQHLKKD